MIYEFRRATGKRKMQQLTQETVNAYMDFVNSMFSFGQQGAQAAERGAQEAPPRGGGGGDQ